MLGTAIKTKNQMLVYLPCSFFINLRTPFISKLKTSFIKLNSQKKIA
jgi:hypothetical protein